MLGEKTVKAITFTWQQKTTSRKINLRERFYEFQSNEFLMSAYKQISNVAITMRNEERRYHIVSDGLYYKLALKY